jgi:hypothetical protein
MGEHRRTVGAEENKVAFLGMIKSVVIKSLVSGDKTVRITIDADSPSQDLIEQLNRVQIPDKQIAVALAEVKA